jgi:hypothetical protein
MICLIYKPWRVAPHFFLQLKLVPNPYICRDTWSEEQGYTLYNFKRIKMEKFIYWLLSIFIRSTESAMKYMKNWNEFQIAKEFENLHKILSETTYISERMQNFVGYYNNAFILRVLKLQNKYLNEKIVIEDTNILRFRIEKAFNTKLMYDKEIGYIWKGKPTVSVREKCCTEDNQKKMELTQAVIEHFAMETI